MPGALLPQHQTQAASAAASAPLATGTDAPKEDGEHAADWCGGPAAGVALAHTSHPDDSDGPAAPDAANPAAPASAAARLAASARASQQHAALLHAENSAPQRRVPGQGRWPGDSSDSTPATSAAGSGASSSSGGNGHADPAGGGDPAADGPGSDFPEADSAPDAPDAADGNEPSADSQRSRWPYRSRHGAGRNSAAASMGAGGLTPSSAAAGDAEAIHDVRGPAGSADEYGTSARDGPGPRRRSAQTTASAPGSLTKPPADSQVSQLTHAAAAGAQHPSLQPSAAGRFHQAAGRQVRGLPEPPGDAGAARNAPGAAGAPATAGHARAAGGGAPQPGLAEHEPHAGGRAEAQHAAAAAAATAAAGHGRDESSGAADEHESLGDGSPVPRPPDEAAPDDRAAAPAAAARSGTRAGAGDGQPQPVPAAPGRRVPPAAATAATAAANAAPHAADAARKHGTDKPAPPGDECRDRSQFAAGFPAEAASAADGVPSSAQSYEPPAAHAPHPGPVPTPPGPAAPFIAHQPSAFSAACTLAAAPVPAPPFQPVPPDATSAFSTPRLPADQLPTSRTGSCPG